MKILIVEDDPKILNFIKAGLLKEGHSVHTAKDGVSGLNLARSKQYGLLILDIMLPKMNGLAVLEEIRKEKIILTVLILSAKRSVEDKVRGLELGADDYMVKPFSYAELNARVNALSRRCPEVAETEQLQFHELILDRFKRLVFFRKKVIELQSREFLLLELLMRNQERVLSKSFILDRVFNIDFDPQTNVVDVLVFRLRSKLERYTGRRFIFTVRGIGFVLKNDDT